MYVLHDAVNPFPLTSISSNMLDSFGSIIDGYITLG